jgi:hypothetical protein
MKTIMKVRNVLMVLVMTIFSISELVASPLHAGKGKEKDVPVQINYLGQKNEMPVFELQIDNNEENSYIINIKDGSGRLLLSERLSAKKIIRKYLLEADELEMIGTTFEVINITTSETGNYKVNKYQRVEEKITVGRF